MTSDSQKKRLLAWSDSPALPSGMGKITRNVLQALHQTGEYEIEQIAINHLGSFLDTSEIPWQVQSAGAKNPNDALGQSLFLDALRDRHYDLVWVHVDIQHLGRLHKSITKLKESRKKEGKSFPHIILYAPIDMPLRENHACCFEHADTIVSESQYGKQEIIKIIPKRKDEVKVIGVGQDPRLAYRIGDVTRKIFRRTHFGIEDDSSFLVINVNRNTTRKQLAHTLSVFARFKFEIPDAKLYLHSEVAGRGCAVDIPMAMKELGLDPFHDVVLNRDYSLGNPTPEETLIAIYNAADCFFTTAFGEGWGLTHADALAVGLPLVAPDNTVFPELLDGGSNGYLYPCREQIWYENIGYRPAPRIQDALAALKLAYDDFVSLRSEGKTSQDNPKVIGAKKWAENYRWNAICDQWLDLIQGIP